MKKFRLFALISLLFALPFCTSCGDGEVTTYQTYTVNIESGEVILLPDVKDFITAELKKFGTDDLFGNFTDDQAIYKTDAFMNKLVRDIKEKNFRVFEGSTLTARLYNVMNEEVHDKTVKLEAAGEPAKTYMKITIVEATPEGNVKAATEFIEGLMGDYEFTKTSEAVENSNNPTSTYVYEQDCATLEEALAAYDKASWANNFIGQIENSWPSDVIYTSKISIVQEYVSELSGEGNASRQHYIRQNPSLISKTVWTTTDENAPFAKMEIVDVNTTTAPVYLTFNVKLDGELSELNVMQLGYFITMLDSDYKLVNAFSIKSNSSIQLIKLDGAVVENGAIYTCEQ